MDRIKKSHTGSPIRLWLWVIFLIITFLFCLMCGRSKIPWNEIFNNLFSPQKGGVYSTIIWQIRIPRLLLSMLVGAGLAASGCVFQAVLRNPLAGPYTLGVSGGAAFGASMGAIFGWGSIGLPLAAFAGALLSIFIIYSIASRKYFSITSLILSGVVLSFLFSSLVLLIFALMRTEKIHATLLWLMGNLSAPGIGSLKLISSIILGGITLLLFFNRELDLLSLGKEKAIHLGIDTEKTLRIIFIIASLVTGACVAAAGIIGFVGLIAPHFMRRVVGPSHLNLIIVSSLGGAIFLSLSDTLARTIIYPVELPVGVITGICGGIVFFILLLRTKTWEIF